MSSSGKRKSVKKERKSASGKKSSVKKERKSASVKKSSVKKERKSASGKREKQKQPAKSWITMVKEGASELNADLKKQVSKTTSSAKKNILSKLGISKSAVNKFISAEKKSAKRRYTDVKDHFSYKVKEVVSYGAVVSIGLIGAYAKYKYEKSIKMGGYKTLYRGLETEYNKKKQDISSLTLQDYAKWILGRSVMDKIILTFKKSEDAFIAEGKKKFGQKYKQELLEMAGLDYTEGEMTERLKEHSQERKRVLDKIQEDERKRADELERYRKEDARHREQTRNEDAQQYQKLKRDRVIQQKRKILFKWFPDAIDDLIVLNMKDIQKIDTQMTQFQNRYVALLDASSEMMTQMDKFTPSDDKKCDRNDKTHIYEPIEISRKKTIKSWVIWLQDALEIRHDYHDLVIDFKNIQNIVKSQPFSDPSTTLVTIINNKITSTQQDMENFSEQYVHVLKLLQKYNDRIVNRWTDDMFNKKIDPIFTIYVAKMKRKGLADGKIYLNDVADFVQRIEEGRGYNSALTRDMPCLTTLFRENYTKLLTENGEKYLKEQNTHKVVNNVEHKIKKIQQSDWNFGRLEPTVFKRTRKGLMNWIQS